MTQLVFQEMILKLLLCSCRLDHHRTQTFILEKPKLIFPEAVLVEPYRVGYWDSPHFKIKKQILYIYTFGNAYFFFKESVG
jgi:hypothetical protein